MLLLQWANTLFDLQLLQLLHNSWGESLDSVNKITDFVLEKNAVQLLANVWEPGKRKVAYPCQKTYLGMLCQDVRLCTSRNIYIPDKQMLINLDSAVAANRKPAKNSIRSKTVKNKKASVKNTSDLLLLIIEHFCSVANSMNFCY